MGRLEIIGGTLVLMLLIPKTLGWGTEGHYATCKIAEAFLTQDTLSAVKNLLPDYAEGSLSSVCSWADQVKRNYRFRFSNQLHYIDTPDNKCNYQYCRDCHDSDGNKDQCLSGAIYNYTTQLLPASKNSYLKTGYNSTEALLFLAHFFGDIHQPLHVSFTGDKGGNTIIVHWYTRKNNLHHIWDSSIIETAMTEMYDSDLDAFIKAIQTKITDSDINAWGPCENKLAVCPDLYASEGISLACKYAYKDVANGTTLGDAYFKSRLPIVETRLAQGGVRLASTLNRIFSFSDPTPRIPHSPNCARLY